MRFKVYGKSAGVVCVTKAIFSLLVGLAVLVSFPLPGSLLFFIPPLLVMIYYIKRAGMFFKEPW